MSEQIYWIVEFSIKPGELDSFRALVRDLIASTEANEPGTLNYEWTLAADNQSGHIYERYADSEAALVHLRTFGDQFADRFMASAEVTRMVTHGRPSPELKVVLDGFNSGYLEPIGGFAR